jgi:hypothetical protein|tara:strand:- start:20 stop:601 length:582 start_codon:yes stop_codon:yes gene_type:complete
MSVDARATVTLTRAEAKFTYTTVKAATVYTQRMQSIATRLDDSLNDWFYDSAVISEVLVKVIAKPVAENLSVTELYESAYSKPTVDSLSVADTFARVLTWHRELTDAFTLDDAAQIDKDYFGNKGNITQLLDVLNIQLSTNYADSYSVNDVLVLVMNFVGNHSDSVSVGDVPIIRNRSGTLMNGTFFNNITLN